MHAGASTRAAYFEKEKLIDWLTATGGAGLQALAEGLARLGGRLPAGEAATAGVALITPALQLLQRLIETSGKPASSARRCQERSWEHRCTEIGIHSNMAVRP